jgi:DNA-binding NarL/FixJ family response regulator
VTAAADVVGVIEAAYAEAPDDESWLRRVTEPAARHLDQGHGAIAYAYDVSQGRVRRVAEVHLGASKAVVEAVLQSEANHPPEWIPRMYLCGPVCAAGSSQAGLSREDWKHMPPISQAIERCHACDSLGIVTGDSNGLGVSLQFPKHTIGPIPKTTSAVWSRVAAHIAAAYRLRLARPPVTEAILSPSGRVEHVEASAGATNERTALAEGARRMNAARGKLRRDDPRQAVELWRALVAGRWSLVDHFDHDGKRFLLAKRNERPVARELGTLSERQRDVLSLAALGHGNKFIAYQLGLTSSAVAMILARTARKLGVASRVHLIEVARRSLGASRGSA